jgi:hypothetical protein
MFLMKVVKQKKSPSPRRLFYTFIKENKEIWRRAYAVYEKNLLSYIVNPSEDGGNCDLCGVFPSKDGVN